MQRHLITDFIVLKTQVEKTEKNTHVYLVIERNFVRRHDAPFSFLFYAVNIHDTMGVLYHPRLRIAGAWGKPDDFGYTLDVSSGPNFHRRFSFTSEHVFTEFFFIINFGNGQHYYKVQSVYNRPVRLSDAVPQCPDILRYQIQIQLLA